MKKTEVAGVLKCHFSKSNQIIKCFSQLVQKFEQGDWKSTLTLSGNFVELVIKSIYTFAGEKLPDSRNFKVSNFIQKIIQLNRDKLNSDSIRLQIPRACTFLYDITSNRGGRHHSDEHDPNEMDATISIELCSWILAELVRFCSKHNISPDEAQSIITLLVEKRYPFFEEIENRIYVDKERHSSSIQCALMILYKKFPQRMSKSKLIEEVQRNGYKKTSINFSRLLKYVDINDQKGIFLRSFGRKKVEQLLRKNN